MRFAQLKTVFRYPAVDPARANRLQKGVRIAAFVAGWCAVASVVGARGHAQKPPDNAPAQVLRVQTRLVQVNVVVQDKEGRLVPGLSRDDFTVFDGKTQEKIEFFSAESGRSLRPPFTPLAPNVFSNRLTREGGVPENVVVILLDGLNSEFADQAYAREQIIKFLKQLQPGQRVALYTLGNHLSIIQDFTTDPGPLLEAIRQYRGENSSALGRQPNADEVLSPALTGLNAVAAAQLQAGLADAFAKVNAFYTRVRVEKTIQALVSIAQHLSGMAGRKSLIWVSSGFPSWAGIDPGNTMTAEYEFARQIRAAAQALNQVDVAIYPVDARGLFTDPDFSAQNQSAPTSGRRGRALAAMMDTIGTMQTLADQTGGRAFYNTNDLQGSIQSAFEDASLTYTLGYYPTHGKWNGEYRTIRVTVDRPGVKVRHRRGYFAGSQPPAGNKKEEKGMISEAAQDPLEATALGVTVALRPFRSYVGKQIEITVSVDPRDLTFQSAQGHWQGTVEIWAAQCSGKGKVKGGISKTLTLNLTEANYQKLLNRGLSLSFSEQVSSGSDKLVVVARDTPSGKTGWVNVPLRKFLSAAKDK